MTVNRKYASEDFRYLIAVMGHEFLRDDASNSPAEEAINTSLTAMTVSENRGVDSGPRHRINKRFAAPSGPPRSGTPEQHRAPSQEGSPVRRPTSRRVGTPSCGSGSPGPSRWSTRPGLLRPEGRSGPATSCSGDVTRFARGCMSTSRRADRAKGGRRGRITTGRGGHSPVPRSPLRNEGAKSSELGGVAASSSRRPEPCCSRRRGPGSAWPTPARDGHLAGDRQDLAPAPPPGRIRPSTGSSR